MILIKVPKIPPPSDSGGPAGWQLAWWWLMRRNGIKMSYTRTQLALGDRLVHFITLRNNYLGPGTT
jgi:hypothetical protein